ncbi:MAG: tRNA-dihydrouridine synthase family protein [Victivallales bacterium]|jgi:tRNA-dihydrouridine synthase|nr:tRNA-dihydrouridine synthase family protein [Victivallales bacterium]
MGNPEFWLGPMEGVMTPELLEAATSLHLVKRWMTPFFRVNADAPKPKTLKAFLAPFGGELPVTVQLMGVSPEAMAMTAQTLSQLGVNAFNLNFGCPSRQVTSGGAGGGALRNIDGMLRTVETVKNAIGDLELSVKIRTGWSDPGEQELFLPRLVASGCVGKFFIHYRTVKEQYAGVDGREERLKRAIELAENVPVILNGDVNTPDDSESLLKRLPQAAGIMCARGWLHDPFLLRRLEHLPAPDPETGREQFFRTVVKAGFPVNKSIELSNYIWGRKNNPYFRHLLTLPAGAAFRLSP